MVKKTLFSATVIALMMGSAFAQANLHNFTLPSFNVPPGGFVGGIKFGGQQPFPSGFGAGHLGNLPGFIGGKAGNPPSKPDVQLGDCSKGPC